MATLLTIAPIWVTIVSLWILCILVLPIGRKYYEGFPYNISTASAYGDVALIFCVMISAVILHRQEAPRWLASNAYQIGFLVICVIGGPLYHTLIRVISSWEPQTEMDTYHNVFIVPLLVYSMITAAPLNLSVGTSLERYGTILLGGIWIVSMIIDYKTGRLQQTEWLKKHGPVTLV